MGAIVIGLLSLILILYINSFLMKQLISRDFKVKYKRSILGVAWSLLYPILTMSVLAIVFS
ncbi:MAG: ABC transporter permease, partial [Oscillospiraceae bacterium]|nr:ABC transporter permease [Oscillospiraceae bacterium]